MKSVMNFSVVYSETILSYVYTVELCRKNQKLVVFPFTAGIEKSVRFGSG